MPKSRGPHFVTALAIYTIANTLQKKQVHISNNIICAAVSVLP